MTIYYSYKSKIFKFLSKKFSNQYPSLNRPISVGYRLDIGWKFRFRGEISVGYRSGGKDIGRISVGYRTSTDIGRRSSKNSGKSRTSVRILIVSWFFKIFVGSSPRKCAKNPAKIKILPLTGDFYEFFKNMCLLFHFLFFHDFLQIFVMPSPQKWARPRTTMI